MKTKEEIEKELLFLEKGHQYPENYEDEKRFFFGQGWICALRFVLGDKDIVQIDGEPISYFGIPLTGDNIMTYYKPEEIE
jgi:hypothetical protein